jgi:PKD repeat protein
MQGASAAQNMGTLDFTNTWQVVTDPPGYPELRSLSGGPDPSLTAGFTVTPENPTVGEQLTLNADQSTPESDIESYDWTLGDGTTATGKQVTHTYTDSGQFTVELTVQDGTETDTATETVTISSTPPPLPGYESAPQDPDQDGLFEDVDGDGDFTIFDVQVFFVNFKGQTVQNNPAPFNFDESAGVSLIDVQALFTELS